MQISGYGAVNQSQWPYEQQRRTRAASDESVRRGDTVSFSAEALELLARSQAAKNNADTPAESTESSESRSRAAEDKNDTASANTALSISGKTESASGSDTSFGDTAGEQAEDKAQSSSTHEANQKSNTEEDIDSKIKGLKGQIEQVARQIANIYKLPIDTQQKVEMAQPLEERINQLQQEIQALEAQKAAAAADAAAGQKQG